MSVEIRLAVSSVEAGVQLAVHAGDTSTNTVLTAEQAGALGGALLSAAHAPLPAELSYLVRHESEPDDAAPLPKPPPANPVPVSRPSAPEPTDSIPVSYRPSIMTRPWAWEIPSNVAERIVEHGFRESDIRAAASEPDLTKPAPDGRAMNHEAGEVGVIVRGNAIIGVYRVEHAASDIGTPRAKSGGPGRKMPSSYAEARRMLTGLGFELDETRGGGHPILTHPQHPGWQQTLARTTSDSRSWRNAFRDIRVATGIDVTADRTVDA